MVKKVITHIKYPVLIAGIVLCLVGIVQAATGNIDPTDKWAWGTDVGWINFRPEHGGVTVYGDHLEGYAWGENIGWIRLGSHDGGGSHTYGNTTKDNYGVNRDASGNLSGYAWGSNVGWINFNPTHSQVTIDPSTGSFDGYAWGENIGWIHFKGTATNEDSNGMVTNGHSKGTTTNGDTYNVVANFTRKTLTVNKAGTGDGTVTSNPAGINCGADCAEAYDQDTVVTLTANADGDSDFAGWSGDCSGTNSTTTVTMDADKTCTATFNLKPGSIKVCKDVAPDDASVWDFTLSGPTPGTKDDLGDGQCHTWSDRTSGSYTLREATQAGYDTSVDCGAKGSDSDADITFTLSAGESVTCNFTNTQQRGTIIVEKQTNPNGAAGSFTFSGDAAGTISDDGQIVVANLQPGAYTTTEADPSPEFELTSITCNDGNSGGNVGTRTVTFNLAADETVKCTFTNARRSLKVSKELELPVGGLAAVDQIVRFNITVENDGGLTVDPLTLRDDYEPWCLVSRRAEVPPDVHGGSLGFLQWNDLGALAPGESMSLWVEFTAAHGCQEATNRATVETGGLTFEDEATVRILETVARVAGFLFHDETGQGTYHYGANGVENGEVSTDGLSYVTNTSGWYSFNLLGPGTYHVEAAPPADSWWTPTTAEECDATVVNNWDQVFCHFGYWWGLDGPPVAAAVVAEYEVALTPTQDATISEWDQGNHGADEYLRVRQPGMTSALLQFDLSGLPEGAEVVWAKLRLYSPFASNSTNRLYMTAYPLETMWTEDAVTWLGTLDSLVWGDPGATGDHGDPVGWAWIGAPGWVEFDLDSDLLAGWLADPVSNHGLLLQGEGSGNREVAYWFFSRDVANADVQPQLVVGYDVP